MNKNIKVIAFLKVYMEIDFWDDSVRSSLDYYPVKLEIY